METAYANARRIQEVPRVSNIIYDTEFMNWQTQTAEVVAVEGSTEISDEEVNTVRGARLMLDMTISRIPSISLRQSLQRQLDGAKTIADVQRIENKVHGCLANNEVSTRGYATLEA